MPLLLWLCISHHHETVVLWARCCALRRLTHVNRSLERSCGHDSVNMTISNLEELLCCRSAFDFNMVKVVEMPHMLPWNNKHHFTLEVLSTLKIGIDLSFLSFTTTWQHCARCLLSLWNTKLRPTNWLHHAPKAMTFPFHPCYCQFPTFPDYMCSFLYTEGKPGQWKMTRGWFGRLPHLWHSTRIINLYSWWIMWPFHLSECCLRHNVRLRVIGCCFKLL